MIVDLLAFLVQRIIHLTNSNYKHFLVMLDKENNSNIKYIYIFS